MQTKLLGLVSTAKNALRHLHTLHQFLGTKWKVVMSRVHFCAFIFCLQPRSCMSYQSAINLQTGRIIQPKSALKSYLWQPNCSQKGKTANHRREITETVTISCLAAQLAHVFERFKKQNKPFSISRFVPDIGSCLDVNFTQFMKKTVLLNENPESFEKAILNYTNI